jgi:universal stress protein E
VDNSILVVVDPTVGDDQPVIGRAADLARRFACELELYLCDFDPDIDAGQYSTVWIDQPAREHLMGIHRKRLESLAEGLRARGIKVDVDVAWDHPVGEAIVRKAVAAKPWLVMKDTHHHGLLKRTVLSNTDWHLIRGLPASLLLIKKTELGPVPKIFAAVDPVHAHDKPAALDDKILRTAQQFAAKLGGELHVAHSYSVPIGTDFPEDVVDEVAKYHANAMNDFLTKHAIPSERAHLLEGRPERVLPELTERSNAALVVMGAVSRRGVDRLIIGSTAERLLDRLPCDLLIVKPESFDSSLPHG